TCRLVEHRIEGDSGPGEPGQCPCPDPRYMLTDTPAEDDALATPQHAHVGAEVLADAIAVELDCEPGCGRRVGQQGGGTGLRSRHDGEPGSAIQQLDDLI